MKSKYNKYMGYIISLLGIILLYFSFENSSTALMIVGILLVVSGILVFVILSSLELFNKDKEIDYDQVSKLNLTICICSNCLKDNVLEDVYCRFCGEKLEANKNDI